jgi:hypothetical protein
MGQNNPRQFAPPMAQGQATNVYQALRQSQAPQQLSAPYLLPYDVNQNQGMMPFVQSPNSVRPQEQQAPEYSHPFAGILARKQQQDY